MASNIEDSRALAEGKERLALHLASCHRLRDVYRFLEQEVWPVVPKAQLGRRLTRQEESRILGYDRESRP